MSSHAVEKRKVSKMSLLLRVALGLLPVLPVAVENVDDIIAEIKSQDDADVKLKGVLEHAKQLVSAIEAAL